jgi:hypothetical protein
MSKPAAATVPSCQLHIGWLGAVLATVVLLPSAVLAGNPDPTLRRSDQVDVRRLGKVSEDERSVLRIEWRAGLAGVEETRSIDEMIDKLRRLEASISEVSRLISNMPAHKPSVAAIAPVPVAPKAPDSSGHNLRLAAANLAALALVMIWWFRRRRPATGPGTGPASSPENVLPGAAAKIPTPPASAPLAREPLVEAPSGVPSVATREPVAVTPAIPGDEPPPSEPGEAPRAAPVPDPGATTEPVATASFKPPEAKPSGPVNANDTMVIDLPLEEAGPEAVARENAPLQAPPPVSAPKPPKAPPETETNVEPTLQLAEIMLSMGLEQGAAQTLIEYIETHPRQAVYHWLKLLGIYRSRGLKKEFAETAGKLRTHFNIQAEEWGKPAADNAPTLENFSRVSEHVQKIWSQPEECMNYMQHLLEDNRDGGRAGFPQSVAEEILFLVEILKNDQA